MMPALTTANLLTYALQVTVIVAIGGALPFLLRVRAPRARLTYWRALLLACLVLPFLQPGPAPAPQLLAPGDFAAAPVAAEGEPGGGPVAATAAAAVPAPARWPVGPLVAVALLAGLAGRLAWLGLGMLTLQRMRRKAPLLLPRPASVQEACELVGADAEFRSAPAFARPVTFGAHTPVVLLPYRFEALEAGQQKAIACHELLHVKRHDWLRTTADELVRAVAWFHPAIWWLLDQIHLTREQVVDRQVVSLVGGRQAYLEALLRLAVPAERPALRPASLFLKRAHLRQRVALLVKENRMSKMRLAVAFAAMALVVTLGGRLVVRAMPLEMVMAPAVAEAPAGHAQSLATDVSKPIARKSTSPAVAPAGSGSPAGAPQQAVRPGVVPPTPPSAGVGGGVQGGVAGGVRGGVVGGVQGGVAAAERAEAAMRAFDQAVAARGPAALRALTRADPVVSASTGMAIVEAIVDVNGYPSVVKVAATDPVIEVAASDAVRLWTFEPPGEPVTTFIGFNVTPATTSTVVHPYVRVGGNIRPPRKVFDSKPTYPPEALASGLQGVQILEVAIDESGNVRSALSLRATDPSLIVEAIRAVLRWRFTPVVAIDSQAPVPALMTVTVNFSTAVTTQVQAQAAGRGLGFGPAQWPPETVRVGGNIRPPTKIVDVRAVYPQVAQAARVTGVVICEVMIGPDGKVQGARVLRSIPLLDQAALDAVRQWEFTPTLLNGTPVPVIMTVTVNFTLD